MSQSIPVLSLGSCTLELLSDEIGAEFSEIETFSTHVGGSAVNVAVGLRRLGVPVGLVSAVGDDASGRLATALLAKENVDTRFVTTRPGRTPLTLIGAELPTNFERVFYNHAAPGLTADDITSVPLDGLAYLVIACDALVETSPRKHTVRLVQRARADGVQVVLNCETDPALWDSPEQFWMYLGEIVPYCNLVVGSPMQLLGLVGEDVALAWRRDAALTQAQEAALNEQIAARVGEEQVWVVHRDILGAAAFQRSEDPLYVPGYRTDVFNKMGKGDAFLSALLYGRLQGKEWFPTLRYASAVSSMVGKAYEIASAMPRREEVDSFLANFGVYEMPPD